MAFLAGFVFVLLVCGSRSDVDVTTKEDTTMRVSSSTTTQSSNTERSIQQYSTTETYDVTYQSKQEETTLNTASATEVKSEHDNNPKLSVPTYIPTDSQNSSDSTVTVVSTEGNITEDDKTESHPTLSSLKEKILDVETDSNVTTNQSDNSRSADAVTDSEVTTSSTKTTEQDDDKSNTESTESRTTAAKAGTTTAPELKPSVIFQSKEAVGTSSPDLTSTLLTIFGVIVGVAGALVLLLVIGYVHGYVKSSERRKLCLNKDANRTDWLTMRRFTINDVKASLGCIPANRDIWTEMSKDSSSVV